MSLVENHHQTFRGWGRVGEPLCFWAPSYELAIQKADRPIRHLRNGEDLSWIEEDVNLIQEWTLQASFTELHISPSH